MSSFCLLLILLSSFVYPSTSEIFRPPDHQLEKETEFWLTQGRREIENAIHKPIVNKPAKNVILFIGDGLGITVNTAGRIYKGQKLGHSGEEQILAWEKFPNIALLKTYNLDRQVADSAGTATAYLSGVKGNFETFGVNGKVAVDDCIASLEDQNRVSSIITWGQEVGKDTGIVTTTRMTHATPGAAYAHVSNRSWECDAKMLEEFKSTCKDIAVQLIEESPGRDINVLLGGGRRQFGASLATDTDSSCLRKDGRNLAQEWQKDKMDRGFSHIYVTNKNEFDNIDVDTHDYIFGLFSGNHLPYELDRDPNESPSLAELVDTAIRRLRRNNQGYVLLVESGRIDHGLHDTKAKYALEDLVALDEAVERAINLVNLDDTLVIITADHSHAIAMSGYPVRGNNILGLTTHKKVTDKMPYTTLMFSHGASVNFSVYNETHVTRVNLTEVDTTDKDFLFPSLVPTIHGNEVHGGEDVAAWAAGPMAHLFHTVHEQTYVAHVIGYAACMGPYKENCNVAPTHEKPNVKHLLNNECSGASTLLSSCKLAIFVIFWFSCVFS